MRRSFGIELNNASGIYKIQSLIDSRCYIGSATRFRKRYNEHKSTLLKGSHRNPYLQRFFNKHGDSSLEFIVLELCDTQHLVEREQYYIDKLKPKFNLCQTAGNSLGRECSKETRQKISSANKGKPKNMPPEWYDIMAEINRKKNVSPEMRAKVSKAKGIPVAQYDLDGKFLRSYESSKQAALHNNYLGEMSMPVVKEKRLKVLVAINGNSLMATQIT